MRILFASAHPYLPQIRGGAQVTQHELVREFMARGHRVSVLAGLSGQGPTALRGRVLMKVLRRSVVSDALAGYTVYRAWFAWEVVEQVLALERPDVVLVHSGQPARMGLAFQKVKAPLVLYLHNVEYDDHGGPFEELIHARFIANSQFTADTYRRKYGIQSVVVPPFFRREAYVTKTSRENVTFINPHRLKGLDLAIEVAKRCPSVPFSFVESWKLDDSELKALVARLRHLPNVRLRKCAPDMRKVYGRARVILVPSMWQEAWGRVASEAHFSGIPVVALRRGGLPEAVGPGGVLMEPEAAVDDWANVIQRLWTDEPYYAGLSAAALEYSRRPALNGDAQIESLVNVLRDACATQSGQHG